MTSPKVSLSRIASRLAVAGLVGGSSLFFASCRTPQTLCEEWRTEMLATAEACLTLSDMEFAMLSREIGPFDPMNPARRGCGIISSVSEPGELVNDCFPILRTLQDRCPNPAELEMDPDYAMFAAEFPRNLPGVCDAGHFEVIR